jgi:hypothetical protein
VTVCSECSFIIIIISVGLYCVGLENQCSVVDSHRNDKTELFVAKKEKKKQVKKGLELLVCLIVSLSLQTHLLVFPPPTLNPTLISCRYSLQRLHTSASFTYSLAAQPHHYDTETKKKLITSSSPIHLVIS